MAHFAFAPTHKTNALAKAKEPFFSQPSLDNHVLCHNSQV